MTGIAIPPWVVPGPKLMPGARRIAASLSKLMLVGLVTVHPPAPQRWKAPQLTALASASLTDIWAWTGTAAPASNRAAACGGSGDEETIDSSRCGHVSRRRRRSGPGPDVGQ